MHLADVLIVVGHVHALLLEQASKALPAEAAVA